MTDDRPSICLNCIYGSQPYGYYPIVCVHGKRSKVMYHDKTQCKHFEACPDENQLPPPPAAAVPEPAARRENT